MNLIITRIRSGGQTGADRAALDTARKFNIECEEAYRVTAEILGKVFEELTS